MPPGRGAGSHRRTAPSIGLRDQPHSTSTVDRRAAPSGPGPRSSATAVCCAPRELAVPPGRPPRVRTAGLPARAMTTAQRRAPPRVPLDYSQVAPVPKRPACHPDCPDLPAPRPPPQLPPGKADTRTAGQPDFISHSGMEPLNPMTPVMRSMVNLSRLLRKGLLPRTGAHNVYISACAIDPPGRKDPAEIPREIERGMVDAYLRAPHPDVPGSVQG
jgi:hypothetical protein